MCKRLLCMALCFCMMVTAAACGKSTAPPELPAPSMTAEQLEKEIDFSAIEALFTAEDGDVYIPASNTASPKSDIPKATKPDQVWSENIPYTGDFTMPDTAQLKDGSMGILTIPKIGLSANIYETESEMEAMTKGIAHFTITSAWQGNVGLAAHNINFDGSNGYFKWLYTLKPGDTFTYKTAQGERSYKVDTIKEIDETDWCYLGRTEDNRITMITCISNRPTQRLCVQGVEIKQ